MKTSAFTLSLLIAGIAMYMVYTFIEGKEAEYIKKYGTEVAVVVAKTDIQELDILDDSKVTNIKVPQRFVQPGSFKNLEEVFNKIAVAPILKGEHITKTKVTYPGASTGLSRQVSSGKRAISISVSDDRAVSKLLKPGDRVDILASIDFSGQKDKARVITVLQDILVLSTGLSVSNNLPLANMKESSSGEAKMIKLNTYASFSTVTLELDPFQAQKLVWLTNHSSAPILALRNSNDKNIVHINGTKIYDVMGDEAQEAKEYFMNKNAVEPKR